MNIGIYVYAFRYVCTYMYIYTYVKNDVYIYNILYIHIYIYIYTYMHIYISSIYIFGGQGSRWGIPVMSVMMLHPGPHAPASGVLLGFRVLCLP